MAKKIRVKFAWLVFLEIVLLICSLYLHAIGENGKACLLFFLLVYLFSELAKMLRDRYFYRELCSEVEDVGKNPAHQTFKIYRLGSVALWVRCAPESEKERFASYLEKMSEDDFGYGELKYIVEQFKKQ